MRLLEPRELGKLSRMQLIHVHADAVRELMETEAAYGNSVNAMAAAASAAQSALRQLSDARMMAARAFSEIERRLLETEIASEASVGGGR